MKIKLGILLILAVLMMPSCKTNETNYRAAYEVAKEKALGGIDEDTYSRMQAEAMPGKTVINGDTLHVITQFVKVTKNAGNDGALLHRYNIVVAQFRQVFNAKAMRDRLTGQGYDAYIIENSDPVYYVVAKGTDVQNEVAGIVKELASNESIVLRDPYPCVLEPINFRTSNKK